MFRVMGYEKDRYTGGYYVYDDETHEQVADFGGDCEASRKDAQALADKLNTPQLNCRGYGRNGAFGWWRV